jgi:hypothetical protein
VTWLFAGLEGMPPHWALVMYLRHLNHRQLVMHNDPNPMMTTAGLHCEIRRILRRKKYICTNLREIDNGHIAVDFPSELTAPVPDSGPHPPLSVTRGAFLARWKSDSQRRIAKKTIWHNGEHYLPHPVLRPIVRAAAAIRYPRDLDDVGL